MCSGGSKDLSLESTAVIQMGSPGSLDQCVLVKVMISSLILNV